MSQISGKARILFAAAALACLPITSAHASDTKSSAPAGCLETASSAICGSIPVPEDRRRRGGREINLHYALVPGERRDIAPLYLIAGGPGQSAIDVAPSMVALLRSVHKGDLIFVDQRGTGRSAPLNCDGGFSILDRDASAAFDRCRTRLAGIADVRFYTTPDAVADLEAVRRHFGHDKIDLFAVSYGTRVAAAYMRQHGSHVRAALLRAIAPPDFNIIGEAPGSIEREIDTLLAECAADPACARAYPKSREIIEAWRERLDRAAETVALPGGRSMSVTSGLFDSFLYVMLLSVPSRQNLPALLHQIETGLAPVAPILDQVQSAIYGDIPVGMYLSVVCSEDAPRVRRDLLDADAKGLGRDAGSLVDLCERWPRRPLPADLFQPLESNVPVLAISGANDPSTTVAAGDRMLQGLPNGVHLVLPATSHAPPLPECAVAPAANFFATARAERTDSCAALALPPFAGTAPASLQTSSNTP